MASGDTPASSSDRSDRSIPEPDHSKGPEWSRALTLSDVMIMVGGVALVLAAGSHLFPLLADMVMRLGHEATVSIANAPGNWPSFWRTIRFSFINTIGYATQIVEIVLAGMIPVFLIVRMKRPRPKLRALLLQPGTVAALAMVFGLFWITGLLLTAFPRRFDSFTAAPIAVGGTVAICWGILRLSRKWNTEPGWIDRLGRTLGCAAIAIAVLVPLTFWP
jgi:hypothetical protein